MAFVHIEGRSVVLRLSSFLQTTDIGFGPETKTTLKEPIISVLSALVARYKIYVGACAVASVLAGAATLAPSAAQADSGYGYCQAAGCNGLDPYYENCTVNAFTVSSETYTYSNGSRYEVDLRYSPDCEANWARVVSSTAVRFCVQNNFGNVQRYTSAPGLVSWTNMVNGGPGTHDTAYLALPSPTENLGQNVLWASDAPGSGEMFNYPC